MSATGDVNFGVSHRTNNVEAVSSSRQVHPAQSASGEKRRGQHNRPGGFRGRYSSGDGKMAGGNHFYRQQQNRPKDHYRYDNRSEYRGYQGPTGERKDQVLEIHDQEQWPAIGEAKGAKPAPARLSIQTTVFRPRNQNTTVSAAAAAATPEEPRESTTKPASHTLPQSRPQENNTAAPKKNKKKFVSISIESQASESSEFAHPHSHGREGRHSGNFDDHRGGRFHREKNGYQRSYTDASAYAPGRGQGRRGPRPHVDESYGHNSGYMNQSQNHRFNYERQDSAGGYYNPRSYAGRSVPMNNRGYHHNVAHVSYNSSSPKNLAPEQPAPSSQPVADNDQDANVKAVNIRVSNKRTPIVNGEVAQERNKQPPASAASAPMIVQQPSAPMLGGIVFPGYSAPSHSMMSQSSMMYPVERDRSYLPDDEVVELIRKQVEYYFSVENLQKDFYLRTNMTLEGYVNMDLIHKFNRISNFRRSKEFLINVLRSSPKLDVDHDGRFVRCKENPEIWPAPKPEIDENDPESASDMPVPDSYAAPQGSVSAASQTVGPTSSAESAAVPLAASVHRAPGQMVPGGAYRPQGSHVAHHGVSVVPQNMYTMPPPLGGGVHHPPFMLPPHHVLHMWPPGPAYRGSQPVQAPNNAASDSRSAASSDPTATSPSNQNQVDYASPRDGSNLNSSEHTNTTNHLPDAITSRLSNERMIDPSVASMHHQSQIYFYTSVQPDVSSFNPRQPPPPHHSYKTVQFHPYFQNVCYVPRNGAQILSSGTRTPDQHIPYHPPPPSSNVLDTGLASAQNVDSLTKSFNDKLSFDNKTTSTSQRMGESRRGETLSSPNTDSRPNSLRIASSQSSTDSQQTKSTNDHNSRKPTTPRTTSQPKSEKPVLKKRFKNNEIVSKDAAEKASSSTAL